SPTAVMSYGDGDGGGAVAELVGAENRGIEYMFTMMNNARLAVGVQGLAIAERAYQQARDYARTRIQGRAGDGRDEGPAPIVRHPDVRRMLLTMRARIDAMRALTYFAAGALDRARRHPDADERERNQALVDLLIPVVKAWCTDGGCAVASLGIQVHGGAGYIEETGAAQHFRDARIAPIYEGTNGIQAIDLVGRKLMRDQGAAARGFIAGLRQTDADLAAAPGDDAAAIRRSLAAASAALAGATDWLIATWPGDAPRALAGATPYLDLLGTVAGGWLLAESALAALRRLAQGGAGSGYLEAKLTIARFYADTILAQAPGLAAAVTDGAAGTLAMPEEQF
ncbi:MAG TPA: acyl-CoA dehydrogenase, partial [Dongiaceae bacterium]|nr:acyl-CoA dehydrogenase [Dongiaceae bacterium]